MPAALPVLTVISWLARTEVWAGAINVSVAMGCPSAEMETQVVCAARMSRVNVGWDSAFTARARGFTTAGLTSASVGVEAG